MERPPHPPPARRGRPAAQFALALLAGLACAAAARAGPGRQARYRVTDLGTLPGSEWSTARAVNERGQVAGQAGTADGPTRAFLYANGAMQDLGTLGGEGGPAGSTAYGVNNHGQVVGISDTGTVDEYDSPVSHAFLYEGGVMRDLGTLPGGNHSDARAINDAGQVAGSSTHDGLNLGLAFLHERGAMRALFPGSAGDLDYDEGAIAINDAGQVIIASTVFGHGEDEDSYSTAVYDPKTGDFLNLGRLPGGGHPDPQALNDAGQVVGHAIAADGRPRAFLYDAGTLRDLGALPGDGESTARAVNDRGQVVGSSGDRVFLDSGGRAFLYDGGAMLDLNDLIPADSGWELFDARDINNRGQIVGYGLNPQGRGRAFMLTPVGAPTPIPLPPALYAALATLGLAAAAGRRAMRRIMSAV